MTIDRAAEEIAIAEAIAAGKRTVIPPVDPVERGIEVFRAEKIAAAGHAGGMRKTIVRAQKIKKAKAVSMGRDGTVTDVVVQPPKPRSHKKKVDRLSAAARTCAIHGVIDCARCRHAAIADLAYAFWETFGRLDGYDVQHWLIAERLLQREQT